MGATIVGAPTLKIENSKFSIGFYNFKNVSKDNFAVHVDAITHSKSLEDFVSCVFDVLSHYDVNITKRQILLFLKRNGY